MLVTTNYALKKPEGTDVVDIQNFNDNADIIDLALKKHDTALADLVYPTAGGTANTITLTLPTLVNGYAKTFIAASNNNGSTTTINGKYLYKPGTTTAPNLIAGKAYTVWYSTTSNCFFIKASAEGDAIAANVLASKKFSNDSDTGIVGSMTDNAAVTITPGTANKPIAAGYHNGSGYVAGDADLISANIKAGANIFGVAGNSNVVDTSAGTVTASQMLSGTIGFSKGSQITGTMPVWNPDYGDQHLCTNISTGAWSGDGINYVYMGVPSGSYLNGINWVRRAEPDLLASNIVGGKSIFGLIGSAGSETSGSASVSFTKFSNSYSYYIADVTIDVGLVPNMLYISMPAIGSNKAGSLFWLNSWGLSFINPTSSTTVISITSISGTQVTLHFKSNDYGSESTGTFSWKAKSL